MSTPDPLTYEDQERSSAPVTRKRSNLLAYILVGLVIVVGLAVIALVWFSDTSAPKESRQKKGPSITAHLPTFTMPTFEKPEPPPPPVPKAEPKSLLTQQIAPVPQSPVLPASRPPKVEDPLQRRLDAPLSGGADSGGTSTSSPPPTAADTYQSEIDLRTTVTPAVSATKLADLTFTITKGTFINCVLDGAIQTDQPGFVSCHLTEDVFGADGTVVLFDRGSFLDGEYRSQSISVGQSRIFVVWNRLRTPDGVLVNLGSPGTGPLGRAGLSGFVDNHYWEKVGIPILISFIGDASDFINIDDFDVTVGESNNALSDVLQDFAKIKPTLGKNQGERVSVIVARDIDMSTVFQLRNQHAGPTR